MQSRYVFLAYAHSLEHPLKSLEKEYGGTYPVVQQDGRENGYSLHIEQYANIQNINLAFHTFGKDIVIFHYSGHANPNSILLGDQIINSEGIAGHLKRSAENGVLKLVILNGCSTKEQAENLLALGVPAVIATSAPVEDMSACEFAVFFYKNLCEQGMSIAQAYENALIYAQNSTDQILDERRGVRIPLEGAAGPHWKIYSRDPSDIEINPLPRLTPEELDAGDNIPINRRLRDTLFSALAATGNREVLALQTRENSGDFVYDGAKNECIVSVLPMPIGEHIRKLFVATGAEGYNEERLKQLGRLYFTTMEFLSYVMIAQLWEYKMGQQVSVSSPQKTHLLPASLIEMLTKHFKLKSTERPGFDYRTFFLGMANFFDSRVDLDYFIEELKNFSQLFSPRTPFSQACDGLAALNARIADPGITIASAEITNLCKKAENWIADIFSQLGFLHRYHLTSIQAISILKYRHILNPVYNHSVIKLMRVGSSEKFLYQLDNCLACQGVVLLKGELQLRNREPVTFVPVEPLYFLNLSPFLFDISAFEKGDVSRIGIFDEYIDDYDNYRFKDANMPDSSRDFVKVESRNPYQSVKAEMDYYKKEILGTEIIPQP
jgi:CHAT domain-containing protein